MELNKRRLKTRSKEPDGPSNNEGKVDRSSKNGES